MPNTEILWRIAGVTIVMAFPAIFVRQLGPGFLAFAGSMWLVSVSSLMIIGSPSAIRFVAQNRLLLAWSGFGMIAAGAILAPMSYVYGPGWMNAAENGRYSLAVGSSQGLVMIGVTILGLPKAIADTQRQNSAKPQPGTTEFSGFNECAAALRFVFRNLRALMLMAAPWVVICWGIPWLAYQAMMPIWTNLQPLEHEVVRAGPHYLPPPINVAGLLFFVLIGIGIPSFAVAWHRFVAGGTPSIRGSLLPGHRTFGYLWRLWTALFVICSTTIFVAAMAEDIFSQIGFRVEWLILVVVNLAASFLCTWASSRWLLGLPAIAVSDQPPQDTDLFHVAKALGIGLPLGFGLAIISCLVATLAAILGVTWLFTQRGALAGGVAGAFGFILLFGMTAFVATFLSRAYEAAMRNPAGQALVALKLG